jgi:hypothetical protein
MIAIEDAKVLELVRGEIAREVAELRPLVRAQLVEEMAFVSETEGLKILPLGGKEPLRTFRRLMNDCGVHRIKLRGELFYKRVGERSVMAALEALTRKPEPRRKSAKSQAPNPKLELVA